MTKCWDQSRYAPSQWETSLHCNDVSHWLSPYLDWSLQCNVWPATGALTVHLSNISSTIFPLWSQYNLRCVRTPSYTMYINSAATLVSEFALLPFISPQTTAAYIQGSGFVLWYVRYCSLRKIMGYMRTMGRMPTVDRGQVATQTTEYIQWGKKYKGIRFIYYTVKVWYYTIHEDFQCQKQVSI